MGSGPNETAVTPTVPHFWPAAEAAIVPGLASVRQVPPASELASIVPLPSRAASSLPETASAPGKAATPALIGPPADQVVPASAVEASGVNSRSWLGRTATVSALPVSAAATRPPLSATPGGVTSRQVADLAGRTSTSQNVGLAVMGTMAQLSLAVLSEVASETAGTLAAVESPDEDEDTDVEPHAASAALDVMAAIAAASAPAWTRPRRPAVLGITGSVPSTGARSRPAARRTRTAWRPWPVPDHRLFPVGPRHRR